MPVPSGYYAGKVTLSIANGPGGLQSSWYSLPNVYTFTKADAGSHTFNVTLKCNYADWQIKAADNSTPALSVTTPNINVLTYSQATTALSDTLSTSSPTAGTQFTLTLQAMNGGSVNQTYSGTISFACSDMRTDQYAPESLATAAQTWHALSGYQYTYTTSGRQPDDGVHTFDVLLYTAGTQTITATDTTNNAVTFTAGSIKVGPQSATRLVVSTVPNIAAPNAASGAVELYRDGRGPVRQHRSQL